MPYPLPLTRTEAYLAYKAGVIQQSDLKPSLAVPRNGIDAWLAYWTGLAADYPKREDGTPHILQEEEAYIAYLSGVINEYPEKCLRRVGAYLRYLISARWGRPDHPLNREELYLSLIKTQFIPSGDPSSDIEIDGTAKAPFVDVKMYGDTFQQSYTGKNLLEIRPSDNSRGLTIVPNARTGELTFSGSTTAGYPWLNESFTDLPAGTYTFSIDKPVNKTLYLRLYNEDGTYPVTLQFTAGDTSNTKTTDYAIKRTVMLYGEASSGAAVAKQTIKPMLEAGSTATSYEPYVGGTPSPNPEYPQPIQTVTGEQTVEIVGKNLWGGFASDFRKTSSGVTFVNKADGTITANGTSTGTALSLFSVDAISQNRLITLSAGDYTISGATDVVRLEVINTSGGVVADTSGSISGVKAFSISAPTQVAVRAKMGNTDVADNVTVKPMLEKGSDATAYEPYSSNNYEIWLDSLSKNLFDKTTATIGKRIGANGTTITDASYFVSDFIRIKPNTQYVISPSTYLPYSAVATYKEDKTLITRRIGADFSAITTESDAAFVRLTTDKTAIDTTQFEEGATSSPYESYISAELCKLGTYQDYIWKDGEDWKIRKNTNRFTFETPKVYGLSKQNLGFVYSTDNNPLVGKHIPLVGECSHFDVEATDATWTGLNRTGMNSGGALWFRTTDSAQGDTRTSQEFAQWLVDAGVSYVYALETPTDVVITNQNLIAQLEALVKGGSEDGTTYIKVSAADPNLPAKLYVEAAKYV